MAGMRDENIYKRPYVRPNENWVCGRSAEGRPCPHGPTRRGSCAMQFECVPAKIGDRWVCTRPDQYGGPCDSPALPSPSFGPYLKDGRGTCCRKAHCTPHRSLRARRGNLTLISCTLITGAILVALGGPWRDRFLSPGPLTSHHQGASMASLESMAQGKLHAAEVRGGGGDEGCHICHTALDGGLRGLVSSAPGDAGKTTQSAQCLVCHQADLGWDALVTHTLSPAILAQHSEEATQEDSAAGKPFSLTLASFFPEAKHIAGGPIACAMCHQEHNGALFDLTQMENDSCQTCHTRQFRSVAKGHPEFSTLESASAYDYPYRRRTRIVFDHARHETAHFRKEENRALAPADCDDCHEITGSAGTTQLVPFEKMCAACHANNIVSARDEWIHVFGYPSVEADVYEILEEDGGAETVPRTAGKPLSPFMLLLLSGMSAGSPDTAQAFRADLAKIVAFEADLSGIAYDDDPKIVARLFDGLKSIRNAAMDPDAGGMREAFRALIERAGGGELSAQRLDALLGGPDPQLTIEKVEEEVSRKDIVEMSGWHVRGGGYRIDPAAWSSALQTVPEYAALKEIGGGGDAFEWFGNFSEVKEWFDGHIHMDGEHWTLKSSGEEVKSQDWEELMAEISRSSGSRQDATPKSADSSKKPQEKDSKRAGQAVAEESASAETTASKEKAAFDAWLGNLSGVKRWFESTIDPAGGAWTLLSPKSLYYRPVQHADPFMVAWLDLAGVLYGKNLAAAMLFDQVSGRKTGSAIGACTKCHSIDAEKSPGGETLVRVNWNSRPAVRDFTKFNHSPHLKLMNCSECHRAPWIPAMQERAQVAMAASAEEEVSAEPAPHDTPAGDEPAPESAGGPPVTAIVPAMAYLDSFKAGSEGLEIGVNFMNPRHAGGAQAPVFTSNFEPMIKADCVRCHVPGKAGDSCLICHNYHIQPMNTAAGIRSLSEFITEQAGATDPTQSSEESKGALAPP